jgi:hypothetical protein
LKPRPGVPLLTFRHASADLPIERVDGGRAPEVAAVVADPRDALRLGLISRLELVEMSCPEAPGL